MTAALAEAVVRRAHARGTTLATAESCTGGLIAAALTDVPGASAVFTHGVVAYANEAKTGLLGIDPDLIARHGAVSGPVAGAMARGMAERADADAAVSVTGIAGPGGGSAEKPVGLVWFGVASRRDGAGPFVIRCERRVFAGGGRAYVRARAVQTGLRLLLDAI